MGKLCLQFIYFTMARSGSGGGILAPRKLSSQWWWSEIQTLWLVSTTLNRLDIIFTVEFNEHYKLYLKIPSSSRSVVFPKCYLLPQTIVPKTFPYLPNNFSTWSALTSLKKTNLPSHCFRKPPDSPDKWLQLVLQMRLALNSMILGMRPIIFMASTELIEWETRLG